VPHRALHLLLLLLPRNSRRLAVMLPKPTSSSSRAQ
jgi:hypothetical protein